MGEAGHWLPAVEALRSVREVDLDQDHTAEILNPEWDSKVSPELLQFLRTQVVERAQVRQDADGRERVWAKPHPTRMETPGAILDKLWRKGAVLGRKLLCRANRPEPSWLTGRRTPPDQNTPAGCPWRLPSRATRFASRLPHDACVA